MVGRGERVPRTNWPTHNSNVHFEGETLGRVGWSKKTGKAHSLVIAMLRCGYTWGGEMGGGEEEEENESVGHTKSYLLLPHVIPFLLLPSVARSHK